jgi:hypothetical protein
MFDEKQVHESATLALKLITQKKIEDNKLLKRIEEMPLVSGKKAKTRKGFSTNVKREIEAGKPQKQAVAIAYSKARETKKGKKK